MADAGNKTGASATPPWVKVVAIVGAVLLVLVVVLALTGRGGGHGPGRHMSGGNDSRVAPGLRPA